MISREHLDANIASTDVPADFRGRNPGSPAPRRAQVPIGDPEEDDGFGDEDEDGDEDEEEDDEEPWQACEFASRKPERARWDGRAG